MRELQNTTKSDGYERFDVKSSAFEPNSGWETEVEFSKYSKNKNLDNKIIKLANNKFLLKNIFEEYKIIFEESYSPSGWDRKASCPFKGHNDSTPSFGFNLTENRFNCFGCQRGGGPVQFISFMDGRSQIEIANKLLKTTGNLQDVIVELDDLEITTDLSDELLFDFSEFIRKFNFRNIENPNALKFGEHIAWSLDVYLAKNAPIGSVISDNLEVRINKLKEHLNSFGDY